jgi:hypothetical protein
VLFLRFVNLASIVQCHSCTEQVWLAQSCKACLLKTDSPLAMQTSSLAIDYVLHAHIASHVQALALCWLATCWHARWLSRTACSASDQQPGVLRRTR